MTASADPEIESGGPAGQAARIVAVRITDGLGNQLFQYACGRAVALASGARLRLDISHYGPKSFREFRLDRFCIDADIIAQDESAALDRPFRMKRWMKALFWARQLTGAGAGIRYYREKYGRRSRWPRRLKRATIPCYLVGYWQNLAHFGHIREQLVCEISPRWDVSPATRRVEELIVGCKSVSVHVRRGDYLVPEVRSFFGLLGPKWYERACDRLCASLDGVSFFVFGDDIDWVRQNVVFPGRVTFVEHNDASQAHEDLFLMSRCAHHVISNSTLAWWGAWLGTRAESIVVAPKWWWAKRTTDALGLLGVGWQTVE